MSYKVVKSILGAVVGFGPNTEGYQPIVPDGGWIEISETSPQIPPLTDEELAREKLLAGGFLNKAQLIYFIENMRAVAALELGVTKEQAHALGMAGNPMYAQMVALLAEVDALGV